MRVQGWWWGFYLGGWHISRIKNHVSYDKIKCMVETSYYPIILLPSLYSISLYIVIKNFNVCIEMQKECTYK